MSEKPEFYVYVVYRKDGIPCYVGKGKGRRSDHHFKFTHNKHLKNILKCESDQISIKKISENLYEEEAFSLEKSLIKKFGRRDLGNGPLVNLTDGGDGQSGIIKTKETREKLSKSLKGKKRSEEHCRKLSESKKGMKRTLESRIKQSETMKGKLRPEVSKKLKGRSCPWVRERLLGTKCPEHSIRMKGNKLSVGKNTGENSGKPRKLTKDQVLEIRKRATGLESHEEIARDYGIHKSHISSIKNRRTWNWLD